jgi:hypothetical protein
MKIQVCVNLTNHHKDLEKNKEHNNVWSRLAPNFCCLILLIFMMVGMRGKNDPISLDILKKQH